MKKILFFIFVLINITIFSYGTNVKIITEVNSNITYFDYYINFSNNESLNSFSLEKPKDSIIISAESNHNNESIFYSIAGDFYIFKSNNYKDENQYHIKFKTNELSSNIKNSNTFKTYVNFNFPVQELEYKLFINLTTGDIIEVFPRDYSIMDNSIIYWKINDLKKDTLFLVSFDKVSTTKNHNNKDTIISQAIEKNLYYFIGSLLLIILFTLIYFYRKLLKNLIRFNLEFNKKNNKDENKLNLNSNTYENLNKKEITEKNNSNNIESNKENFEEFISKYLTDKESEIVLTVKNNQGISQNDILNIIEGIKKSNLSKIITKLDGKKILKRIRVGKINKIYLGEKLKELKENN